MLPVFAMRAKLNIRAFSCVIVSTDSKLFPFSFGTLAPSSKVKSNALLLNWILTVLSSMAKVVPFNLIASILFS